MKVHTIDDYFRCLPANVRPVLQEVRRTICAAAPGAQETISYQIPALKLNGTTLVHFAAWKQHISLYPVPHGDAEFRKKIAQYRAGKATLRFSLRQPIPFDLIASTVEHLVAEHSENRDRRVRKA